jgi:penicillin-binding protein 1A
MARALKGLPEMPLQQPADLVAARISPDTGRLAAAGDSNAVFEFFRPADLAALENGTAGGNSPGVAISSSAEGTDIF